MWRKSPKRSDQLKEQLIGLRTSLEAALAELEGISPRQRGPLGIRSPFRRKLALDTFLASLSSINASSAREALPTIASPLALPRLPSARRKRRGPEATGILIAAAAAFAAAGAALLWFGGPRQAASVVSRVLPGSSAGSSERFESWATPGAV